MYISYNWNIHTPILVQQELPLHLLSPPSPNPPQGRMDLVVTSGDFQTNILADVTITHPFPSSTSPITNTMLNPLHFTKIKEAAKRNKYQHAARASGATVVPLVLETFGSSGPAFQRFLNICADGFLQKIFLSHPSRQETHKSLIMRSWRSRISCALQKANIRLLFSKASRASSANQTGQRPHYVDITEVFGSRLQ